jgi:hypothetical protein
MWNIIGVQRLLVRAARPQKARVRPVVILGSAQPGTRLCENSNSQKCASIKSISYPIKNAEIRGFHTVWHWSRRAIALYLY